MGGKKTTLKNSKKNFKMHKLYYLTVKLRKTEYDMKYYF